MVIRAEDVVIRWGDPRSELVPLLREGGITVVLAAAAPAEFRTRCGEAGIAVYPETSLALAGWTGIKQAGAESTAFSDTRWPGVARGPSSNQQGETAGASRQPWVDANSYLVECLRALYPRRLAMLAYSPPADTLVPFDSLELALLETRMAGGNCVLAMDARYRERLLGGDEKARSAWRQLGRTTAWLKKHQAMFGRPILPVVTALVEPSESCLEIASLLFRHGVSPAIGDAADPPPPDSARRFAVVAVGLQEPTPEIRDRILAHAEAGSTLVVDSPVWRRTPALKLLREASDRKVYSLGRGRIVVYNEPIRDPSEFAFDVIDLITQEQRAVRLWNAPTAVAVATAAPPSLGRALLRLTNYGNRASDVLARIHGEYRRATLLAVDGTASTLETKLRGAGTEVFLPELDRAAVIVFTESA